jgi:hypothetical protein
MLEKSKTNKDQIFVVSRVKTSEFNNQRSFHMECIITKVNFKINILALGEVGSLNAQSKIEGSKS